MNLKDFLKAFMRLGVRIKFSDKSWETFSSGVLCIDN